MTVTKINSAITFYVKNYKINPSHYFLKSAYTDNGMRSWTFEGSNDNNTWFILDDQSKRYQNFLGKELHLGCISYKAYSFFKVTQIGKNSNGNYQMTLYMFDLYGSFVSNSDRIQTQCVNLYPIALRIQIYVLFVM